ncbi:DUF1120 domain-containing protein [Leclercia sp. Colony189]|uniref:DUF1120 domain-containing protein n=1 Tax=Leclercia sp. Colony189 TaxID=2681309 RepID=UPI002028DE4C|nr:DUF1120 domain-containing protein [Leclercia sp. Colony189]
MMRGFCLLIAAFMAVPVMASDTVSIDFELTADAAACTPVLSNNGVVDFNSRSAGSLTRNAFTQLGTRDLVLSITCESSTAVAITARDTRATSVVWGRDNQGQEGPRFQINGGQYVSDPSRLFGLGMTAENKPIGSYAVQIDAMNVIASDGDRSVAVEVAGAVNPKGTWEKSDPLPLPTKQDYFYTLVQKGTLAPQPISTATIPLQVSATVANALGSSQTIKLDGEAVISLVYL